jgi:Tol biopolymer transport system component
VRWLFVVVVIAGCGFEHGVAPGDARVVADTADAPVVDMNVGTTCYDQWLDGTIRFDTPVLLATINDNIAYDRDPFLAADELSIYFSTGRTGIAKVFTAKRSSPNSDFGMPVEASEFSSTANEAKLSISADNKIAVVGSDRFGTTGGFDVWESIRTSTTAQWPAMNRTNVMMVETFGNEHDPTLSADGQHLYLAPDQPSPQRIAVATRGGDGMFGTPVTLANVNGTNGDGDPSPTPDERILAFSSNRSGSGDMYYATRATATADFGAPQIIPDVNTSGPEGDPHVSTDGCRLYFARALVSFQYDLYMATARP